MTLDEMIRYCEEQAEFYKPVTEGRSVFTAIIAALRAGQQMRVNSPSNWECAKAWDRAVKGEDRTPLEDWDKSGMPKPFNGDW